MKVARLGQFLWALGIAITIAALSEHAASAEILDAGAIEADLARVGPSYCEAIMAAVERRDFAVLADPAATLRDDVDPVAAGTARAVLDVFNGASDEALAELGAVTVCDGRALPALVLAAEAGFLAGWYAPQCHGARAIEAALRRAQAATGLTHDADPARLVVRAGSEALRCAPTSPSATEWRRALASAARAMARSIVTGPAEEAPAEATQLLAALLAAAREARGAEPERSIHEALLALTEQGVLARVRQAAPGEADRLALVAGSVRMLGARPAALANRAALLLEPGRAVTTDEVSAASADLRDALAATTTATARTELLLRQAQLLAGTAGSALGTNGQRAAVTEERLAEVLRTDPSPPPGAVEAWADAMFHRLKHEGEGQTATQVARLRLQALGQAPVPLPLGLLRLRLELVEETRVPSGDLVHDTWRDVLRRGLLLDACREGLVEQMVGLLNPEASTHLIQEIVSISRQSCGEVRSTGSDTYEP